VEIKNRQQVLFIGAVVGLALFAANKIVVDPLLGAWADRNKQIERLHTDLAEGKALLRREQSIRGRWDYMRSNTLTNDTSAAEQQLFAALDGWRQASRVAISGATPQWKHDADDYMTYQCRIDAAGSLNNLSQFLYDIEKGPMALKLDSVEISAHDKDGQQLVLGLQISGLVLTPQTK
jgi:hypothetical protein